jgi:cyclopropane-fatty-acyl-phospholipid synthase
MPPAGITPVATLWLRDRRTLLELALDPEVGFGEAYSEGRIQVEGDLVLALELVYRAMADAHIDFNWYQRLTSKWMGWIRPTP